MQRNAWVVGSASIQQPQLPLLMRSSHLPFGSFTFPYCPQFSCFHPWNGASNQLSQPRNSLPRSVWRCNARSKLGIPGFLPSFLYLPRDSLALRRLSESEGLRLETHRPLVHNRSFILRIENQLAQADPRNSMVKSGSDEGKEWSSWNGSWLKWRHTL